MKKIRLVCIITTMVAIIMISIGVFLQHDLSSNQKSTADIYNFKIQNMAASANMIVKDTKKANSEDKERALFTEVEMETAPASVIVPPRVEVYDGMTLEELGDKLNKNLGTDIVSGKGSLIAAECINKGVDPYIATAILLHETGCGSNCSSLARNCYNFGGQKGGPSCNGGAFKKFDSIDAGLVGLIDNLQRNYFAIGLTTPETIGPKYCVGNEWPGKINWYINKIRNS